MGEFFSFMSESTFIREYAGSIGEFPGSISEFSSSISEFPGSIGEFPSSIGESKSRLSRDSFLTNYFTVNSLSASRTAIRPNTTHFPNELPVM